MPIESLGTGRASLAGEDITVGSTPLGRNSDSASASPIDCMQPPTNPVTAEKILRNFRALAVGNALAYFFAFLAVTYLGRALGAAGFGRISLAMAVFNYALLLTDMGVKTLGMRDLARDITTRPRYLATVLQLRLGLALISFLCLALFAFLSAKPAEVRLLMVLFGTALVPASLFLDWFFLGVEQMDRVAVAKMLVYASYFGLLVFAVRREEHVLLVPICFFIGNVAGSALLWFFFIREYGWPERRCATRRISYLCEAFPLGIALLAVQLYLNLDVVLLSLMKDDATVGLYSAAVNIRVLLSNCGSMAVLAMFPAISRIWKENPAHLSSFLTETTRIFLAFAMPLAVGGSLLAREVLSAVYGPKYADGGAALQILIWAVALAFVNYNYGNPLMACDKQKKYAVGVALGAGLNGIANLILIPRLGLRGAASSAVLTEAAILAFMMYAARDIFRIRIARHLGKPAVASSIMALALIWMSPWHLSIKIPVGTLLYFVALLILGGVGRQDLRALWQGPLSARVSPGVLQGGQRD
jgi:O-antigen/teichoic acid export membrane protein